MPAMMAVGVARPKRAGAGDHQHRDQREQALCEGVFAAEVPPHDGAEHGDTDHHGHEDRRDLVHQLLHGGLAALRFLHGAHDLREQGGRAHLLCGHPQTAFLVDGAREQPSPFALFATGIGSPLIMLSST
jgi:hypothetical protein